MSIGYTLSNGIATGQPNCQRLVRSKAHQNVAYAGGSYAPLFVGGDMNGNGTGIFEMGFSAGGNVLNAGEYLYLFRCAGLRKVKGAKLIIDNTVTAGNGLGAGSSFSLGIATVDKSQIALLEAANVAQSNGITGGLNCEALPVFVENRDGSGNNLSSLHTNPTYFLGATSGVPSSTNVLSYDVLDMSNMYGFSAADNGFKEDIICLVNASGTVAIVEGRVRMHLDFL